MALEPTDLTTRLGQPLLRGDDVSPARAWELARLHGHTISVLERHLDELLRRAGQQAPYVLYVSDTCNSYAFNQGGRICFNANTWVADCERKGASKFDGECFALVADVFAHELAHNRFRKHAAPHDCLRRRLLSILLAASD